VRVTAINKAGGQSKAIEIQRHGGLDAEQLDVFTSLAKNYQVE
jgi:hypothetical protein